MTRGAAIISMLVALAPLCATRAAAQHAPALGGIEGYVVDSHGKPIVGAHVLALGTPRVAVTGSEPVPSSMRTTRASSRISSAGSNSSSGAPVRRGRTPYGPESPACGVVFVYTR